MRQSFEEFLRQKHKESNAPDDNPYNKWLLCLHPITWQIYAEQWSSQQPEDEVEVWCGCGDKLSKRSDGFYWCLGCDHGVEILAKHKERRAS